MSLASSSLRWSLAGSSRSKRQHRQQRVPSLLARRPLPSRATRAGLASRPRRSPASAAMEALIFDCDGVILDSEDLHRRAYNLAFEYFQVRCPGEPSPVSWSEEFYCMLQNTVGGGKPKMRWYFARNGWPASTVLDGSKPRTEQEQTRLIDVLQDYKTEQYKALIASGTVSPRPGVLRLLDQAQSRGVKTAICSAATKSSVEFVCEKLLGQGRVAKLDCFLAGDDVREKKPSPLIYETAAQRMGIKNKRACVVVEDSLIGLQAALSAGMRCIITFTTSTAGEDFAGAERVYPNLGEDASAGVDLEEIEEVLVAAGQK